MQGAPLSTPSWLLFSFVNPFLHAKRHRTSISHRLADRVKVLPLEPWQAVAIGVASLAAGWAIYDRLCNSAVGREDGRLAAVGFVLLIAAAWFYAHVFSGRGAYIHTGALIGTIMVANVFLVIIPNQKIVVADLIAGRSPDQPVRAGLPGVRRAPPCVDRRLTPARLQFGRQWFVVGFR